MSKFGYVGFKDENGSPYGIKHSNNKPRVSNTPFLYDIAQGNISGHLNVFCNGYNPDVDNTEEHLWPVGGLYSFPSSAIQMQVVSTNANDAAAGTGVQTVRIHYLDNTYAEQTEDIILNGTTPVNTVATNILRINAFHAIAAGSGGKASGNISIQSVGGGTTYGQITPGRNNAQQAIYTVPAGKTFYIVKWGVSIGNSSGSNFATFRLEATCDNEDGTVFANLFFTKSTISCKDGHYDHEFQLPIKCPAQTDIIISVIGDTVNADAICTAIFEGWYE